MCSKYRVACDVRCLVPTYVRPAYRSGVRASVVAEILGHMMMEVAKTSESSVPAEDAL
jgi:hypothetical protein